MENFNRMAQLLRGNGGHQRFEESVVPHATLEGDELCEAIFAPDPFTGVPRSDLAFMMSKDSRPEVAQYIQSVLQNPRGSFATDDVDFALDTIKSKTETLNQYADRLRELCSPKTQE